MRTLWPVIGHNVSKHEVNHGISLKKKKGHPKSDTRLASGTGLPRYMSNLLRKHKPDDSKA